ncbi:hypothetical protein YC2023_005763 [Brassica napus]
MHALGAYFVTTTTPLTPAKKLPAVGGDGGTALDDGAYDGVRKLFVGQAQDGISVVKFVYAKGAEEIIGDEHGNSTLLGFEEFVLDYPSEYITSVEGTYDKIFGSDSEVFTMLRFKTNKQTSAPFGIEALGHPSNSKRKAPRSSGSTEKSASCYISLEFMSFQSLIDHHMFSFHSFEIVNYVRVNKFPTFSVLFVYVSSVF